jgi:hypothetical protein
MKIQKKVENTNPNPHLIWHIYSHSQKHYYDGKWELNLNMFHKYDVKNLLKVIKKMNTNMISRHFSMLANNIKFECYACICF